MRRPDTPVPSVRRAVGALVAGLAVAAAGLGAAGCAAPPTADPNSCGGRTIDRAAPVVAGGDVVVAAPVASVWAVHTDVASYPRWKSGVASAQRLDPGPWQPGSRFRWTNGPLSIESTVLASETARCTLWSGPAQGIDGVHLWTFTPAPGGTVVHTEESWSGPAVTRDPAGARALLDRSLAVGRGDLARKAESR